jgi:vacuolar-type H+-ATPase subunit C/Vma6
MRQLSKYSYVNAKIRAMLSYLIQPGTFAELAEAKDIYGVIEGLKQTAYKNVVGDLQSDSIDPDKLERELLKYDLGLYSRVQSALSLGREKDFVSLMRQRYELEEIKIALRIWHNKLPLDIRDYLTAPKISFDIDFAKITASETIEELILVLGHTPYLAALLKAKDVYKEKKSVFYLEASLDVDYYQRLLDCIEGFSSVDKKVARKVLGVAIDIENINSLIRFRKYYSLPIGQMLDWIVPGGSWVNKDSVRKFYTTDGLTKVVESVALGPYAEIKGMVESNVVFIENFLYDILLREVRKALSGFPFTIGTILGYLILKHRETRNIISLLNAKAYGWNKQEIAGVLNI